MHQPEPAFTLGYGRRKHLIGRWNSLLSTLGVEPEAHFFVLDSLLTRYSEPQRLYHNLSHVDALLEMLPTRAYHELAAWFHDAVYDPTRADNEARSAELAQDYLNHLGISAQLIQKTCQIILATAAHQTDDPETALFLDADLSILGAEPKIYRAYAWAIRQEYAWVPEALFQEHRTQVLQSFLSRVQIYQTQAFAHLEQPARENLAQELETLTQPTSGAQQASASQ